MTDIRVYKLARIKEADTVNFNSGVLFSSGVALLFVSDSSDTVGFQNRYSDLF